MIHLAVCNNESCAKRNECYRYMTENHKELCVLLFQNICNERNNYKMFYKIGDKPVRKLELEGGE